MCKFMYNLPKRSEAMGNKKIKKNVTLTMKPCPDKTWYRFRLLFFKGDTDRDHPWIKRSVHRHWSRNENGQPIIESEIVCPSRTPWIPKESWYDNDKFGCPICKFANQNMASYKDTKDDEARKKAFGFMPDEEYLIPVYVISDPHYPQNNGRCKVLVIPAATKAEREAGNDPIKKLESLIEAITLGGGNVFNGNFGRDLCIQVGVDQIPTKSGGVFNKRCIKKIAFGKTPSEIPEITAEKVDELEYDETFYVPSTEDEIRDFYSKYVQFANYDDIDGEEEEELPKLKRVVSTKKYTPTPITQKVTPKPVVNDLVEDDENLLLSDIDDLLGDVVTDEAPKKSSTRVPPPTRDSEIVDDIDVDALLDGMV